VTTAPAASIMVTIAAASTRTTAWGYKNRETAAHYGQQQREKYQTNILFHGFFLS
jgi:hypothetical protein